MLEIIPHVLRKHRSRLRNEVALIRSRAMTIHVEGRDVTDEKICEYESLLSELEMILARDVGLDA